MRVHRPGREGDAREGHSLRGDVPELVHPSSRTATCPSASPAGWRGRSPSRARCSRPARSRTRSTWRATRRSASRSSSTWRSRGSSGPTSPSGVPAGSTTSTPTGTTSPGWRGRSSGWTGRTCTTCSSMHADARGEMAARDRADTVFSVHEGVTPFDTDEILGEFLPDDRAVATTMNLITEPYLGPERPLAHGPAATSSPSSTPSRSSSTRRTDPRSATSPPGTATSAATSAWAG